MSRVGGSTVRERTLDGLGFAECPRWHNGALWFSDMAFRRVHRMVPGADLEVVCELDDRPGGLGWLPDGSLLVVAMHRRQILRLTAASHLEVYADLTGAVVADLNDMVVDAAGRAYVTNFGYDAATEPRAPTAIVLVRPDRSVEVQAGELYRPNGCAVSADGRRLAVAETRAHRLAGYRIGADGSLHDQHQLADLGSGRWADGICADDEGAIWVADPKKQSCLRVLADGRVEEIVEFAPLSPTACWLGGSDGRTLYVTAAPVRPMEEAELDPRGCIEQVRVEVAGTCARV